MYFIRIESFVFSGLSQCTNILPVLKSSFLSVLFCFVVGITGDSKSSWEANLSSGRCKIDTREGNHCHWSGSSSLHPGEGGGRGTVRVKYLAKVSCHNTMFSARALDRTLNGPVPHHSTYSSPTTSPHSTFFCLSSSSPTPSPSEACYAG